MKKEIIVVAGIALITGLALLFSKEEEKVLIDEEVTKNNSLVFMIEQDGEYTQTDTIPTEGYIFNASKSTCSNSATPTWENNRLYISNLNKSGTSCYLYFDEVCGSACQTILNDRTVQTRSFPITTSTKVEGTNNHGDIYQAEDDDGTTYYFAGNPDDNWVKFAGHYWRIIRINGDGSIRIIYSGTGSPQTNGEGTQITVDGSNLSTFNDSYNASYYAGLKYTESEQYGTITESIILQKLNTWYTNNISSTYRDKIDMNAGFCGDRNMDSNTPTWVAVPSNTIYYAGYERLGRNSNNVNPTFKCSDNRDLYTISSSNKGNKSLTNPIGLITADEVVYGGLSWSGSLIDNYLYTAQNYWTVSPSRYNVTTGHALVFYVFYSGSIGNNDVNVGNGIRPVINLRADVTLTGDGTSSNPYTVEGAA